LKKLRAFGDEAINDEYTLRWLTIRASGDPVEALNVAELGPNDIDALSPRLGFGWVPVWGRMTRAAYHLNRGALHRDRAAVVGAALADHDPAPVASPLHLREVFQFIA